MPSVSETGCSLSGSSGNYTLTVQSPQAGITKRSCTVTAGTATRTVTITFTTAAPTAPPAPSGVAVECTSGNQVIMRWSPAVGADKYNVIVAERPPAPGKSSTETHSVLHYDPPAGQKLSLSVPGTVGWDYSAAVTSVITGPAPDLESAPASATANARCTGVEVQCQADGRIKTTWVRVAGASRYRLRISVTTTTSTQAVTLPDTFVAQPAQATRTVFRYWVARPGERHEVSVAALTGGTWSDVSAPAATTCNGNRPPAPTGVTASCSNRVLTVTWNSAGEGQRKATSYQLRFFTGNPMTESANWTVDTTATTATILVRDEPRLPDTGIFQVEVKATNTAGDSPYSRPIEATCGSPGPITGLKCTAITKDQITIEWNKAVGAQNYSLIIEPSPTGVSQPPLSITALEQAKQSHTFDGLYSGHLHRMAVQPTNAKLGPTATLECTTLDNDWLQADCSGSGILRVRWDDPSGPQAAPSGYAGTITLASPLLDGLVASYDEAYDNSDSSVEWGVIGAPGAEYEAYVKSKNANGGPVYSQTKALTCPPLSGPDYSGPNVPEDPSWLERIAARIAIGVLSQHSGYGAVIATKLFFGGADYVLDQVSSSCSTAHDIATGITTKTCDEVWNEYITVRLDESSLDETISTVADAIVPADEVELLASLVGGTFSLRLLWSTIKKKGAKKVAAKVVSTSGAGVALETYAIWLYYEGTAPYAEINGQDNCVFEQPENRCDDIKNWTAVKVKVSATETVGKIKSVRNAVVHYCKETE